MDAWYNIRLTMVEGRMDERRRDAAAERGMRAARISRPTAAVRSHVVAKPQLRPTALPLTGG